MTARNRNRLDALTRHFSDALPSRLLAALDDVKALSPGEFEALCDRDPATLTDGELLSLHAALTRHPVHGAVMAELAGMTLDELNAALDKTA